MSAVVAFLLLSGATVSQASYVQLVISTVNQISPLNGMWLSMRTPETPPPKDPPPPHLYLVEPVDAKLRLGFDNGISEEEYASSTWSVKPAVDAKGRVIDHDSWAVFSAVDLKHVKSTSKKQNLDSLHKQTLHLGYTEPKVGQPGAVGLYRPKDLESHGFKSRLLKAGQRGHWNALTFQGWSAIYKEREMMTVQQKTLFDAITHPLGITNPNTPLFICPQTKPPRGFPLRVTLAHTVAPSNDCERMTFTLRTPYPVYKSYSDIRIAAMRQRLRDKTELHSWTVKNNIKKEKQRNAEREKQERARELARVDPNSFSKVDLGQVQEATDSDEEGFGQSDTDWHSVDDEHWEPNDGAADVLNMGMGLSSSVVEFESDNAAPEFSN